MTLKDIAEKAGVKYDDRFKCNKWKHNRVSQKNREKVNAIIKNVAMFLTLARGV